MKKLISIFLLLAMLTAIVPLSGITAVAADTPWDGSYDVSWCTAGTENGTDSVQIDGNWYKVLNYASGTVFEIKDAKDLAGLAKLCNSRYTNNRSNPFFANCTFYITDDIVLTGSTWTPIAMHFNNSSTNSTNAQIFGGNLIGSKGDAQNGNGGVITITGMNVNVADATGDRQYAAGLIGVIGGGSVKNITLSEAKIVSADGYATGSFVGRQWGALADKFTTDADKNARCQTIYENLVSDAEITQTNATYKNLHNATGGIVGLLSTGVYSTTIKGCTFTGTIDNGGTCSGGIVGYTESSGSVTIADCVVTAPSIITKSPVNDRGTGGLVGATVESITMSNCYVSSTIYCQDSSSGLVAGAGMVGSATNSLSFEDCHFDGIIYVEAWYFPAAFVSDTYVTGKTFTLKNCLNTGVVMVPNYKNTLHTRGMTWFGRVRGGNSTTPNTFNISDCYTLTDSMFCIEDSSGYNYYSGKSLRNLSSTVVSTRAIRGENATTAMAGLFATNSKWVTRSGMYPTLAIAKDIADTKYATADYSWFDYDAVSPAAPVVIDDFDQLLALSRISKACTKTYSANQGYTFALFIEKYTIKLSTALKASVTTELFSAADVATLNGVVVGTINDENVNNLKIQQSTIEGNNAVRISAQIKGYEWDNATFEYFITYTGNDGVEYSSVIKTAEVHNCYTQIYAGDTPVDPQNDGYYFVVLVISDIDDSWTDVKVSFTVSVEKDGVTTYSTPVEYPAENPLEF